MSGDVSDRHVKIGERYKQSVFVELKEKIGCHRGGFLFLFYNFFAIP